MNDERGLYSEEDDRRRDSEREGESLVVPGRYEGSIRQNKERRDLEEDGGDGNRRRIEENDKGNIRGYEIRDRDRKKDNRSVQDRERGETGMPTQPNFI